MKKGIENIFPTIISRGKLKEATELNKKLLDEIQSFSAEDKMGREWSKENYRGGYTSYASLSDMHHRAPAFSQFEELMQPHAKEFAKAHQWQMRGLSLEMTACWMNIMPKHTYHTLHFHPHSVISGAYYVTAPKGSVSLRLEDPRMSHFMNAPVGKSPYYEVSPDPGSFILFESWLRHEVPPNRSDKARVSISFNYSLVEN
jgi:uncharacterized protein (TIGR02466 family)